MIELFGTLTSPFARRVRIVANELGLPCTLVDTSSEPGITHLREVTPIWKVPTARIDGVTLFDSQVIDRYLIGHHGHGPLLPAPDDPAHTNFVTVIDDALDAAINVLYLNRDGVEATGSAYLNKQVERTASAMAWIAARLPDGRILKRDGFGLPEIALYTAIDWMRFRERYPVATNQALRGFVERHRERPSVTATVPPA